MTDWDALIAAKLGTTVDTYRQARKASNIRALRAIADHLETSGRRDPSGNTAATFRACAALLEK